jgi:hypothetical protein
MVRCEGKTISSCELRRFCVGGGSTRFGERRVASSALSVLEAFVIPTLVGQAVFEVEVTAISV